MFKHVGCLHIIVLDNHHAGAMLMSRHVALLLFIGSNDSLMSSIRRGLLMLALDAADIIAV